MKTQLAFTNEIPLFMRLEEIASYSQLSPQQQIQYDDSFNNYLAVLGNEAYNKRVGYEHGMKDGIIRTIGGGFIIADFYVAVRGFQAPVRVFQKNSGIIQPVFLRHTAGLLYLIPSRTMFS